MSASVDTGPFESERGRKARAPGQIPARGWKDIAVRVKRELEKDRVASVAAGVAFFGVLSVFPAMIALVSIYGLIADPMDVERQMSSLAKLMPGPAQQVLGERMSALVSSPQNRLSLSLVISVVVALWTASSGTKALIEAVNLAYDETERRGFVKLRGLALLMAVALIVFGLVALGVIAILPIAFEWIGLGGTGRWVAELIRWPLLALAAMVGLSALYRFAPNRSRPRWRWVSLGAVIATVLWLAASIGLSVYVSNFGNYDATYGALAGVIVLMLWMFVSTLSILVGAEINAEMEAQTAEDSTTGPERPMGDRGAYKADTLGESFG